MQNLVSNKRNAQWLTDVSCNTTLTVNKVSRYLKDPMAAHYVELVKIFNVGLV